jgi:hypothetical protein
LLAVRKKLWYLKVKAHLVSKRIIKHSIFEGVSLFVIVANSIVLALEDPTSPT